MGTSSAASSSASASTMFRPTSSDAGDGSGARRTTFSRTMMRTDDSRGSSEEMSSSSAMTYGEVVTLWRESSAFRDVFLSSLRDEPFQAFFWETPPITRDTLDKRYEHVVKEAPNLAGAPPEPEVFAEHLNKAAACSSSVATFLNLGGDAMLVAPCEGAQLGDAGAHFASFLRGAPAEQAHELMAAVGAAVEARVSDRPTWVSTSGSGVSWLHVRLDERPKYYTFAPYTQWPQRRR